VRSVVAVLVAVSAFCAGAPSLAQSPMAPVPPRTEADCHDDVNYPLGICYDDVIKGEEQRLAVIRAQVLHFLQELPIARAAFLKDEKRWQHWAASSCGYYNRAEFGTNGPTFDSGRCRLIILRARQKELTTIGDE